ncbi:hypothetical protein [Variovorax saccharolyticus]|uniref:hypothetical protein n=1 Tax=Variovorax saccharolyticus TaxID=3053516 RepID=UPI002575ED9C|nr:hypothetical protein [Variovorax sp. J31P216]MDM0028685.1 hypothetical protein [Variovorax sp. J31P216]
MNLWDEGFFWYGVQRILHGEVPLRDFQAYDPLRYYWSAALMAVSGQTGMIALRATNAALQVLALLCGLAAIAHSARREGQLACLVAASVTLSAWMIPHFKMADLAASILLVGALTMLIAAPVARCYLVTGICVGFAACLGRNHGIYGLAATCAAILWLNMNRVEGPSLVRAALLLAAGVVIGFLPAIVMLLLIPGFAIGFWDTIRFQFSYKATNIGLPVPWPWRADFSGPADVIVRDVMLGLFFIAAPLFGVLALARVIWHRWHRRAVVPAFAASAFLALPYSHYAFSRADFYHLAFGIFPMLIGCFALALTRPGLATRRGATAVLLLASVSTMYSFHAGWQCRLQGQCTSVEVSGSRMRVDLTTAKELAMIERIARQYAPDGRNFVAAPLWPGAYALLERKSPTWEIYGLFQRPPAFEEAEIARIKAAAPGFALVYDLALDGDERLRFKISHPLTYRYFVDNFERVPNPSRPNLELFVSRGNPGLATKPEFLEKSAEELAKLAAGAAKMRILNWGPRSTPAGTVPNAQPDGAAGIWVQVADAEDIGDVRMTLDGKPASSTGVSPAAITAAFAPALFGAEGTHEIAIEQLFTGAVIKVGSFSVAPK